MHPILFKIGPLTIHSYGFFMALGVAFGIWFLYRQARRQGLDAGRLIDAAFYIMIASLIGAKLILLIGNLSYYLSNPKELLWIARSGGVFQGGLAFGVLFALWYFRKHKLPTWKIADIAGPALALGHGFGRIGCFMAGCCYGRTCTLPWAATFQDEYAHGLTGVPVHQALHPVQIYEAVLNFSTPSFSTGLSERKNTTARSSSSISSIIPSSASSPNVSGAITIRHADIFSKVLRPSSACPFPQGFCLVAFAAGMILLRVFKKRSRG